MLYTTLKVQDEEYKLRLTTKTSVQLEKSLGYNPISMLMQIDNGVMPKMGDILIMLQAMNSISITSLRWKPCKDIIKLLQV